MALHSPYPVFSMPGISSKYRWTARANQHRRTSPQTLDTPALSVLPSVVSSSINSEKTRTTACSPCSVVGGWPCELPHPARPGGLAERGASCFCVGACIRRGHSGSRLRRRRFGVSHSYWFDVPVPRADTRFFSRLNVGLLSYSGKERVVPCGTTSESGAVTRNANVITTNEHSGNNCTAV